MTDTTCQHCGKPVGHATRPDCSDCQPDDGRLGAAALDAIGRMLADAVDMTNHAKLTMDYVALSKTAAMLLTECRALMAERDEIAADLAEYLKEDYEAHKGDIRRDQWVDCLAQELADVKAALEQETEAGPLHLRDFAREQNEVFRALNEVFRQLGEIAARLRALEGPKHHCANCGDELSGHGVHTAKYPDKWWCSRECADAPQTCKHCGNASSEPGPEHEDYCADYCQFGSE